MHPILVLLRKDFKLLRRNKAALSLTFIVPFALIYLFGQIFNVNGKDQGPSGIPLAVVNQSDNPAAARLVEALKGEKAFKVLTKFVNPDKSTRPLTEADLRPMMRANEFRFALIIPNDLIRTDRFGLHFKFLSNPRNDIETQTVNGILQKTLFSNVPELLGQAFRDRARSFIGAERFDQFNEDMASAVSNAFGGDQERIRRDIVDGESGLRRLDDDRPADGTPAAPVAAAGSPAADIFTRIVKFDSEQVIGKDVKSPAATRVVGGWAMQFLLFALSASATALFHDKENGIFQRILSAPATRAHILWSKFLYGVCLGLVQLMVLFTAGRILYGIDVEHHIGFLALVCTFAAAACTSFGMLLAAVMPNAEAAQGLATLTILLMSAIGGAWFPVSLMPAFIQSISRFTLVYWSMKGFDQVMWENASFIELLPTLAILGGITAFVMAIAVWRFNRGNLFD